MKQQASNTPKAPVPLASESALWRYMDLAKYVGLLARGLFFALPSTLRQGDAWEGDWGIDEFNRHRESIKGQSAAAAQTRWNQLKTAHFTALDKVGVSCWHQSNGESAALWSVYVPKGMGVAVQSSAERLRAAIEVGPRELRIAEMTYADGPPTAVEAWSVLSRKREAFAFEHEVRALLRLTDDDCKAIGFYKRSFGRPATRLISATDPSSLVLPGEGIALTDGTAFERAGAGGIHIKTNVATLVEQILLPHKLAWRRDGRSSQ